jgi:hypothetical protein
VIIVVGMIFDGHWILTPQEGFDDQIQDMTEAANAAADGVEDDLNIS